jgi:2-haloacid dehalogenase
MLRGTPRPAWITFDCYGTLIQFDEGLLQAVRKILARTGGAVDPEKFIAVYDRHEHAMRDVGIGSDERDAAMLADAISAMPPFPEVVATLGELKRAGFRLCIVSNTDDAIIAGNVAARRAHRSRRDGGAGGRLQRRIFEYAHRASPEEVLHVCASPHLDLVATRELGLRDVWIDRGTGRQPADGYVPAAVLPSLEGLPGLFREAGWM